MIVGICGWQGCGKTSLAVRLAVHLMDRYGYDRQVGNVEIHRTWSIFLDERSEMIRYMVDMVSSKLSNQIVVLDEVDRVFPARFWKDQKQTEALVGLWQDEKLGNFVIYTAHRGVSVDVMLRESTRILMLPEYDEITDRLTIQVCDGRYGRDSKKEILNFSEVFQEYNRWAVVQ